MTVIASGSSGNCYVLEGTRSALILECGVTPERLMAGTTLDMSKVAGCLVSHEHGDHAAYVQRYADLGLPILCSAGTRDALGGITGKVTAPGNLLPTYLGEWCISFLPTRHDAAQPVGFIITHPELGVLLFITDTAPIPLNFRNLRLDHIMVEANYDDALLDEAVASGRVAEAGAARTRRSHLSIRGAVELVKANETAALKDVTLLHLSPYNSNAREFKARMQEAVLFADVYVAKPGCRVVMTRNFNLF
jgi:phosphoribosyl 1,2-cyclic phosphodiesterase